MANLTIKGAQASRAQHLTSECGNHWSDTNAVTSAAALATSDTMVLGEVPAGVVLTTLRFRPKDDFDTGTNQLTMNIGYRSRHADPKMTADATFFASASTSFQASSATWIELVFDPLTVTEPIEIVAVPQVAANAQAAAATVNVQMGGRVVGRV